MQLTHTPPPPSKNTNFMNLELWSQSCLPSNNAHSDKITSSMLKAALQVLLFSASFLLMPYFICYRWSSTASQWMCFTFSLQPIRWALLSVVWEHLILKELLTPFLKLFVFAHPHLTVFSTAFTENIIFYFSICCFGRSETSKLVLAPEGTLLAICSAQNCTLWYVPVYCFDPHSHWLGVSFHGNPISIYTCRSGWLVFSCHWLSLSVNCLNLHTLTMLISP